MDQCGHFAQSLEAIRKIKQSNLAEFSEELDIPKSTLQDILKDGNTSLHTALHIAERLDVSLSALTSETVQKEKLDALTALLKCFAWYTQLSAEDQKVVTTHIRAITEVLQK